MKNSMNVGEYLYSDILSGIKVPHSVSQPLIHCENGKYYLAVFAFFYNKDDIDSGLVERPSLWAIADVETGEIVRKYETKEVEFSDAPYDIKYNVRSDAQFDMSKEYYERAFCILDEVRESLIKRGIFLEDRYNEYMNLIIANIPQEYQRFYYDLSVKVHNVSEKEDKNMGEEKNVNGENSAMDEKTCSPQPLQEPDDASKSAPDDGNDPAQSAEDVEKKEDRPETVLSAIEELQKAFKEKLLIDQHKDQLIDKLHDEVVQYQNGVVNKVVDTMAIDIIQLADNVRKTRAVYSEKEPNAENFTKLLRVVKGLYEDLQDILYRQGIEPYTVDGHDVDARRQTIIASVPTDDEGKHNKIAARTAEGYEREDGSVLRRERVKIFKFQPKEGTDDSK